MAGEEYGESVDVYSFGMMLLCMATAEPALDFIGERWRVSFKKKKAPTVAMRLVNAMAAEVSCLCGRCELFAVELWGSCGCTSLVDTFA
jgi:serine/threonine protein kinase